MAKKTKHGGQQQAFSPQRFVRERMRTVKIGKCYMFADEEWRDGLGYVIVIREHTGGKKSFAVYMVDRWCVGVKDTFFNVRQDDDSIEELLSKVGEYRLQEVSYNEAHNMVWGAVDYAEEAGIKPHKDFATTQYFLEEDTDEIPLIEYEFGKDGKHYLVAKSQLELSKYLQPMKKNLSENEYTCVVADYDEDDDEWDDYDDVEDNFDEE